MFASFGFPFSIATSLTGTGRTSISRVGLGRHHQGGDRPSRARVLGNLQAGSLHGLMGLELLLNQGVLDLVPANDDLLEGSISCSAR
jgi:hypothetical protein